MKKTIVLALLLGVVTPAVAIRERYKIMIRQDLEGKNWYYPMKKTNTSYIFKTWVIAWPSLTEYGAKKTIDDWKFDDEQTRLMNKKKYIYIN